MKRIIIVISIALWCCNLSAQGFVATLDTINDSRNSLSIHELSTGEFQVSSGSLFGGESMNYNISLDGNEITKSNLDFNFEDYVYVLPDDSFITLGVKRTSNILTQICASRFSKDNELIWTNNYTEISTEGAANKVNGVFALSDGLLIYGAQNNQPYLFKIDLNGAVIWERSLDDEGSFYSLNKIGLSTNSLFFDKVESLDDPNANAISFIADISFEENSIEVLVDIVNGDILSENIRVKDQELDDQDIPLTFDSFTEDYFSKINVDDGEIILSQLNVRHSYYDSIRMKNINEWTTIPYISKFDKFNRSRTWSITLGWLVGQRRDSPGHIKLLPNGNVIFIPFLRNQTIREININDGAVENNKFLQLFGDNQFIEVSYHFKVLNVFERDGFFMCATSDSRTRFGRHEVGFFKLDFNLNTFDLEKTYIKGLNKNDLYRSLQKVEELSNGEYVGVGLYSTLSDNYELYTFRANSDGVIYSNVISGNVLGDLDFDCQSGADDINLKDWEVRASKDTEYFTTLSEDDGSYTIQLDTGNYEISIIPINDYWLNCDTAEIKFNNLFDTLSNVNLVTSAIAPCSFIEVDIGFGFLRRCFSNRVVVQYCNQGTFAEDSTMVELHLDPYLDVDTTSIPITEQIDTTLFFDIGFLDIGECGSFTIHVTPNCDDTVLGQEHCINAHVFPDTLCVPADSLWSGANVVVEAFCLGDSTSFRLINQGDVATVNGLQYAIIVDDIIVSRGDTYSLAAGGSIQFVEYHPGSTVKLIADQEPFHPLGNQVGVEAFCAGTDFDFISSFNQFDDDPFTDMVCAENRGSFDPNDKAAIPVGIGPEHFIAANQELEYKVRFQNTGSDTAFTVVIRDTISSLMDMSTFETGIGSHDYVLDIEEGNILIFTFNDILLPDSTTNWTESNGFVEFKISPIGEVVPDDVIENTAAIFFDFNEPVITNTVFHTIETPLVFSIVDVETSCSTPYNEIFYIADTTISEFFYSDFKDSIAIVNIKVINSGQSEIPYNGIDDDCDSLTLDDDLDQDGFSLADDCDDTNADINSAQAEVPYNGIDDDCNSLTLDDDLDQDGFSLADDCDDTNANINSAQAEIPYNGIDDDCDSLTLDDDLDQDGFALSEDCDDTDASINSDQSEIPYNGIDDDCNSLTLDDDLDQDGFSLADDCDDTNANINSAQAEVPYNGIDDDCNSLTLDDDLDQDGFSLADDCDDTNANINSAQAEVPYNGIDDDCDSLTLDDDLDQDGFALSEDCDDTDASINSDQSEIPYNGIDDDCDSLTLDDDLDQDGFISADDCDDTNASINSDQSEIPYNGIDDDCNSLTLDDDLDQDGYALADDCDDTNANINSAQSEVPYNGIDDDCNSLTLDDDLDQDGYSLADDCDDTNANINSDQSEIPYNGIDDDCDSLTLDDDLDQDGFALSEDCDDTDATINPNAEEIPGNGIDEDCDGIDLITSINELTNAIVNIYPNPVIDIVNIDVSGLLNYEITIYDLSGKVLLKEINQSHIRIGNYPLGIYFVEIKDPVSNGKVIRRIIKSI